MEDEATHERQRSLAAPLIFLIVAAFQFAYYRLDHLKKVSYIYIYSPFTVLLINCNKIYTCYSFCNNEIFILIFQLRKSLHSPHDV